MDSGSACMERTGTSRSSPDAPARRPTARRHRWWRRWPEWIGYAAAAWSLAYAVAGLHWARGGAGFPFGALHDPAAHLSVLGGARREIAAPAIAILGLIGAVSGVAMARGWERGRAALLVFAW